MGIFLTDFDHGIPEQRPCVGAGLCHVLAVCRDRLDQRRVRDLPGVDVILSDLMNIKTHCVVSYGHPRTRACGKKIASAFQVADPREPHA